MLSRRQSQRGCGERGRQVPFVGARRTHKGTTSLPIPEDAAIDPLPLHRLVAVAERPSLNSFSRSFLDDSRSIIEQVDDTQVEAVVNVLRETRERGGRLFLCGSGGGAGHASHAACDFRKLARIESYSVTDNVSELTARINDEGWESSYGEWLRSSRLAAADCLFVFSVGGGSLERQVSVNLVRAMHLARDTGASIVGIAGRDGGELRRCADACVVLPSVDARFVTPQTEGLQALIWHLMVSHPALDPESAKWESITDTRPVDHATTN
jgi:D-sedoheptulose 7-phosphate isomerase